MLKFSLTFVAICAGLAAAETHYLFSGFFNGTSIAALEFDDAKSSLDLVKNITINANSSKWISIDESEKNLYVATPGYFQSYSITSGPGLDYQSNASLPSNCSNANHIIAAVKEPYTVFGAPFALGCSAVAISVDDAGSLQSSFANITYDNRAGVHGLALSPQNDFIYSADDMGNAVWVHSYSQSSAVVNEVQRISAPEGSDPRHIAVHPAGLFVYVLYEKSIWKIESSKESTSAFAVAHLDFDSGPANAVWYT
ncbi:hypothetical protein ZTR_04886 [Talaromyces verruculosus]|nr:hypothetical protein ZTR_04886 [Talaromyces verruculosus]